MIFVKRMYIILPLILQEKIVDLYIAENLERKILLEKTFNHDMYMYIHIILILNRNFNYRIYKNIF